ncbi:sulfite exporter TauE/SafE family protein [Parasulfuritortus cantonensis]|uniref:Probable membrane transporter protein n=1 Tax=Parasulfuritortus cantonensis TaxID=2528202 RepID=A0A4R1B6C7_9PROT|nr:sulfite exporter TauE/SafE family protein [Parasulfuritortus cantonensis]TCJ11778.1 sulfite exporter TauE/SafE family protein [Parasulfuritortus cantonensis]
MSAVDQLVLFVASFVANWFSALSGGGAGLIQFPILIFLGLPFGVALATHKVATVFLGLGAALRHLKESHLERRFVLAIVGAGVPGVALGASVILYVPERPAILALGILTLGLGLYSMVKPKLGLDYAPRNRTGIGLAVGLAGLFSVGFLNGSITSGSGLFLTLWLVRHFGLDYKRAVAYTMVVGGVLWNGTGAAVLGVLGNVRWDWMPVLLIGALLGGYLGSHVAIVKGNLWVKRAFEVTTILIGAKLIVG